ncbi:phage major capsid protein [Aureimonas sp. SK2]|uniref:phage major capsid protein n=1 Tax=Aureimonas sp. SK2 TaxID=3015992 RepID=UPI00244505A3|nr:phage major capsid protein [Aureimonas sp. SK2]
MSTQLFAARPLGIAALLTLSLVVALVAIGTAHASPLVEHAVHVASAHDWGGALLASPLVALRASRVELQKKMEALTEASEAEDRDLTEDEERDFQSMREQRAALDKRIARLEELNAGAATLTETRLAAARGGGVIHPPAPGARREFESMGEFMAAVRFNPNDQRLNYVENAAANEGDPASAELRMDDGASGGFAIPPEFRNTLLQVNPQEAIIRPRAQVLQPGSAPDAAVTVTALDQSGAAPGNMFGGVEVKWIGEGDEKPETSLALREITLTPHEVAGTITVTDKLLRNWQGSAAFIETQLRGAVRQSEDFAFLRGDGIKKPLGLLNAGATYKVKRVQANRITYDDVLEMSARGYGNGVFVYSRSALPALSKMTDPEGHYIWTQSAREGEPSTLLGRPAIMSDRNPLLGQFGDLWYGDLSMYLIKDGSGPFVAASEHVLFKQNKTVIKIFWNVDGSPWLRKPLTLENGYEVSPFVALDVPGI